LLSRQRQAGLLEGDLSRHRQHAWFFEDLLT
jgi:hypothetical protein